MSDKSKLTIGITDVGIAEALHRWQLAVPSNQRRYAWDDEYVEQLFHDLTKAFDASKPIYFLGTVVLTEGAKGSREIADGQQRLATTAILLAAMRDYLIELGDGPGATQYQSDFLLKYDPPSGQYKPRIRLNVEDDQYFLNTVLLPPDQRDPETIGKYRSNVRITTAAEKAKEHVRNITSGLSLNDKPERLYEWIISAYERANCCDHCSRAYQRFIQNVRDSQCARPSGVTSRYSQEFLFRKGARFHREDSPSLDVHAQHNRIAWQ